jgi:hypothetical protein
LCFSSKSELHVDEALEPFAALNWVHELNLGLVKFELDSKRTVDSFHTSKCDFTWFGVIAEHCKSIFLTIIETQVQRLYKHK